MTKCDFCTKSDSNGKCPFDLISLREPYCKQAIKRMMAAFKNNNYKKS